MDWSYISGFFDADGSVSYVRNNRGKNKTAQVSFHNTERVVLNRIQSFIETELGYKGSVSIKPSKDINHSISYDLKYSYRAAIEILKRLNIRHPKKRHRKNVLLKISKLIPRNGKYSDAVKKKIDQLILQYK